MDREILFRGKRLDNGEWVEGGYYRHHTGQIGIVSNEKTPAGSAIMDEVDPSTVGQYTGLTDKNGVKIFEGDVMEFTAYGLGYKGKVTFINGNFSVLCKKASPFLDDVVKRGGTVIGNLHDNPELIGGGDDA